MPTLQVSWQDIITGDYQKPQGFGVADYPFGLAESDTIALAPGTGAGQADLMYRTDPATGKTLTAGAFDDLDLNNIILDTLGATLLMAKLKGFRLTAPATNVGDIVVGGAAANAFQGWFDTAAMKSHVSPGGRKAEVNPLVGWTVTPGTGDILRITNAGAQSNVYHLILFGTTV